MKRLIIVVGFVGVLCFSAVALGATATYKGRDQDPRCKSLGPPVRCLITFDGKGQGGRVKTVKNFRYGRVPTTCDNGPDTASSFGLTLPPMQVNRKRKFRGEAIIQDGASKVKVTGRFSKSFKRATGTLRVMSDGIGGRNFACDTGTDDYTVHK